MTHKPKNAGYNPAYVLTYRPKFFAESNGASYPRRRPLLPIQWKDAPGVGLPLASPDMLYKERSPVSYDIELLKVAATYSPTTQCSTIGDAELNDPVRNGKGWDLSAITT